MRALVTGSSGHLGDAMVRVVRERGGEAVGLDLLAGAHTDVVADIVDRAAVRRCIAERGPFDTVLHAATLHKPHVALCSRQAFVDVNISGTLNLLEEASAAAIERFIFTSTTSAFGRALAPHPDAPAAWIDEDVIGPSKNIYGASKTAAEELCQLFSHTHALPCLVLRTSRFFPEEDDSAALREAFADQANLKVNELLYRRVDIADAVDAHLLAAERAPTIGFARYIISATTPFSRDDVAALRADAPAVVARRFPSYAALYAQLGWRMHQSFDRVYDNTRAREQLGWRPRVDFGSALAALARGEDWQSPLARAVGAKGYRPYEPNVR
ncbi:MAG: NAD(P)-dependent oxidoreductase [Myxococcales bacterium]|nr:NAD(P)-dependent oxidoreductase [Myxococcales bacterium]